MATNDPQAVYTSIDLNAVAVTTVYDPGVAGIVHGVFLLVDGGTADARLEMTDGVDTAVLHEPGAGTNLAFVGPIVVPASDSLQVNVVTAQGTALTGTCVVILNENL